MDIAYKNVPLSRRCTMKTLVLLLVCMAISACADVETPTTTRSVDGATVAALHKSAEQGNATAQNRLGLLYNQGQGVPQNPLLAKQWFEKAAERGTLVLKSISAPSISSGKGRSKATKWRCSGFAERQNSKRCWPSRNWGSCMNTDAESPKILSKPTCGTTFLPHGEKSEP